MCVFPLGVELRPREGKKINRNRRSAVIGFLSLLPVPEELETRDLTERQLHRLHGNSGIRFESTKEGNSRRLTRGVGARAEKKKVCNKLSGAPAQ